MLKILSVSIMLFLIGCSLTSKRRTVIVPDGEAAWIYAADTGCESNEICASGEGSSFKESDANAQKALAGIFQTKIKGRFQFSKTNFNDKEISQMQEFVQDEVDQQINQILKGVFIKERFKKDGIKFSLATLRKDESLRILSQELSKIDSEMEHYFALKNRLYIKKLNVLFNKREILNEKIIVINSEGIERKITFAEINNLKFRSSGGTKIRLKTATEMPSVLLKKIEEAFTDVGYKITAKDDGEYFIYVGYKEKEEYLNVSGFTKYSFEITLDSKNNLGKRIGGYVINLVSNGRNKKDAFLKVRGKIVTQINENLAKLNLN